MSDYPKRKLKKLLERIDDRLKQSNKGIVIKGDGKEIVVTGNKGAGLEKMGRIEIKDGGTVTGNHIWGKDPIKDIEEGKRICLEGEE